MCCAYWVCTWMGARCMAVQLCTCSLLQSVHTLDQMKMWVRTCTV